MWWMAEELAAHASCGQRIASAPALAVIDLADGSYHAAYTLTVGGRYTRNPTPICINIYIYVYIDVYIQMFVRIYMFDCICIHI